MPLIDEQAERQGTARRGLRVADRRAVLTPAPVLFGRRSISLEREGAGAAATQTGVLVLFSQETVSDCQRFDPGSQKAAKHVFGVQTIGSPRTLKLVLTSTGHPVRSLNALSRE